MKILFSPSESKRKISTSKPISSKSFIFGSLYEKRLEVVKAYNNFVMAADSASLAKLFGINDERQIEALREDIFQKKTSIAMLRYDGVAYEYLKYDGLDEQAKKYINENCMIFSNLFGPISPLCLLPEYKLKQGEGFGGLKIEAFYKRYFSGAVDEYIGDDEVLDLRAGFYEKFYTLKKPYITVKFLKGGKVVSHYAKAYRGVLLAHMAKQNIMSHDEFSSLQIPELNVCEIRRVGLKNEYVFEIG